MRLKNSRPLGSSGLEADRVSENDILFQSFGFTTVVLVKGNNLIYFVKMSPNSAKISEYNVVLK